MRDTLAASSRSEFSARRNVNEALAKAFYEFGTIWSVEATEKMIADISDELFDLCGEPDDFPDLSLFVDDGVDPAARYVEFQFAAVRQFGADADSTGQLLTIARRCRMCKVRPAVARVRPLSAPRYCSEECMRRFMDRSPRKKQYRRAWASAARERRRELGLCVICGKRPHTDGSVRCDPCRARRRADNSTTPTPEL